MVYLVTIINHNVNQANYGGVLGEESITQNVKQATDIVWFSKSPSEQRKLYWMVSNIILVHHSVLPATKELKMVKVLYHILPLEH